MLKSKFHSQYEINPDWVPNTNNVKGIIDQYDAIDQLTSKYITELAKLMGIDVKEWAHFDTSAHVRDTAMRCIEDEFPDLPLPPAGFDF